MPFNKGDFTQQGVAGHVNANLRLNEKRLVNIDMTSNEEAEGCTIAGTVTDLLNDKVYPIGAGVSGNIEITENTAEGESLNIAQYATATVNVAGGGSDWSTVELTIKQTDFTIYDPDDHFSTCIPVLYNGTYDLLNVEAVNNSITVLLPIYQGSAVCDVDHLVKNTAMTNEIPDISGSAVYDSENYTITITGNFSIGVGLRK